MRRVGLFAARPATDRIRRSMLEHHDFVHRSLRRLGVRPADVEDALQEVFLVLSRRLDGVPVDQERAFLFGTSVRVASTRRRSARRHPEDPVETLDEHATLVMGAEEASELRRLRALLDGILEGMKTDQRAIFVLCELEELSVPDAASILAVPLGTASSRLRSAREAFRVAAKRLERCQAHGSKP